MTGKILWKVIVSALVFIWAGLNLVPLQDQDFGGFLKKEQPKYSSDSAINDRMASVVDEAQKMADEKQAASVFLALMKMGSEGYTYYVDGVAEPLPEGKKPESFQEFSPLDIEKRDDGKFYEKGSKEPLTNARTKGIDFVDFFPAKESHFLDIKNRDKRNEALLQELFHLSRGRMRLGLDLKGGIAYTLKLGKSDSDDQLVYGSNEEQLADVIRIMRKRLDLFGVAEPVIRTRGADMIEIQLPGINSKENPEAIQDLKKPAKLDFRKVLRTAEVLYPPRTPNSPGVADLDPGYVYLKNEATNNETGETYDVYYPVEKRPRAAGDIVKSAVATSDQTGLGYRILLNFTPEGKDKFAAVTGEIAEENKDNRGTPGQLAIVLDGEIRSAPSVSKKIVGGAEITGSFTQREAIELANVLNNPLSVELQLGEMYEVSPTLAKDSQEKSLNAVEWGTILIIAFMIVYYFAGGIVAVVSVVLNVMLVLGVMASLSATITLPGVAALVLTVGMAVDANILIFERIREELQLGKSLPNALEDGYNKAFSTIIDANITTLITAGILYALGTGPVRGFGLTLAIGIGSSVFCALIVSRLFLEVLVHGAGLKKILGLKLIPDDRTWTFLEHRKPMIMGSMILIVAGILYTGANLNNIMGIDFTGGDEVTLIAADGQKLPTESEIHSLRDRLDEVNNAEVFFTQELAGGKEQLKIQVDSDKGDIFVEELQKEYPEKGLELVLKNQIGGSVSKDIQKNAWLAVGFSLIGILLYVALRFELGFGVGAVAATIHDVLITIGLYVLLGKLGLCSGQFTAPMLAALLMILGYSINDTIVLFDRIREELKLHPDYSLKRLVNFSINRVLPRTILTSITTLLAALALYVFGAGIIKDFSFVFILGILTGTYSSIFIASPIFFWWHKGDRKHVETKELAPKYSWAEERA
jgi:SecD/SecF fusion protein